MNVFSLLGVFGLSALSGLQPLRFNNNSLQTSKVSNDGVETFTFTGDALDIVGGSQTSGDKLYTFNFFYWKYIDSGVSYNINNYQFNIDKTFYNYTVYNSYQTSLYQYCYNDMPTDYSFGLLVTTVIEDDLLSLKLIPIFNGSKVQGHTYRFESNIYDKVWNFDDYSDYTYLSTSSVLYFQDEFYPYQYTDGMGVISFDGKTSFENDIISENRYFVGTYTGFQYANFYWNEYDDSLPCYKYIDTSNNPTGLYWSFIDTRLYADNDLNNVYQEGLDDGYANGYGDGTAEGYDDGHAQGYEDGYNVGYQQGKQDGLSVQTYSFGELFGAIADTPILIVRNLFNFDLFGVNVLVAVLSLFTALILFYLLRKLF